MHLDGRLSAVVGMIETGSVVADVGTDHGYVPITLVREGISETVFAIDSRPGPLARARENAVRYACADRIRFLLSDGLKELPPGEADTVVITGMGGLLIKRILDECPEAVRSGIHTFVFGPQSEAEFFRRFLMQQHYTIEKEGIVQDGEKYYPVIRASRGRGGMKEWCPGGAERLVMAGELKSCDYCYGRFLLSLRDPVLYGKIEADIRTLEGILKDRQRLPEGRILELEEELSKRKEARDCYEVR